jgi:hypothetical protein
MPGQQYGRRPNDRGWFCTGSVALRAVLLGALVLPALCFADNTEQTAQKSSVQKEAPKCAPAENTAKEDLPPGDAASTQSSDTSAPAREEFRIQDPASGDSMKLESAGKDKEDDLESAEPECAPGQTGTAEAPCRAAKSSKDSAAQCLRGSDPALKPDLALDREPAK